MKRFALIIMAVIICCSSFCIPVSAASANKVVVEVTDVEYLENGDYIETVITYEEAVTRASKTASKTRNYKNSAGTILWSVTVRGTFTYNGTTSSCTAVSHSSTSSSSAWTIRSITSSKSGSTATAKGVARYTASGSYKDYSMSVSLSCNANGVLS